MRLTTYNWLPAGEGRSDRSGREEAARAGVRLAGHRHPGARDEATRIALRLADLVLVPVHPSQDDLDAVGPTVAEIREAGTPFIFVLSRTTRARIVDEVGRLLAAHSRVAPAVIGARVAHGEAATRGMTAAEAGNQAAVEEMRALVDYVVEVLA